MCFFLLRLIWPNFLGQKLSFSTCEYCWFPNFIQKKKNLTNRLGDNNVRGCFRNQLEWASRPILHKQIYQGHLSNLSFLTLYTTEKNIYWKNFLKIQNKSFLDPFLSIYPNMGANRNFHMKLKKVHKYSRSSLPKKI